MFFDDAGRPTDFVAPADLELTAIEYNVPIAAI